MRPLGWHFVGSVVPLLCAALATGCARGGFSPPPTEGAECESDEDCADGLACLGGYCYQTCVDVVDCSFAGQACYRTVCAPFLIEACGDGLIDPGESCDDAGAVDGDGCDAACQLENGWACDGEPSACRVSEFWVNRRPFGDQRSPAVAMGRDGEPIIVWSGPGADGETDAIYGQRLDANGLFTGDNQIISQSPENGKSAPAVAANRDGAHVVVWVSLEPHPYNHEVYARSFTADGVPVADEIKVNTTHLAGTGQKHPRVAIDRDDNVLVVWQSWDQDGSGQGVYAQRLTLAGELVGPEILVPQVTEGYQHNPDVAAHDGGFVVAWQTAVAGSIHEDSYFRRLATDGSFLADETLVSQVTQGHQWNPTVAATPSGSFIVGHHGVGVDGGQWTVNARWFLADGSAAGDQLRLSVDDDGSQTFLRLAAADDGRTAAVWTRADQDGDGDGIFGRAIQPDGSILPLQEVQLNDFSAGEQTAAAVAIRLANGGAVVVWESDGQDGDGWGIYGQRFTADILPLGLEPW